MLAVEVTFHILSTKFLDLEVNSLTLPSIAARLLIPTRHNYVSERPRTRLPVLIVYLFW